MSEESEMYERIARIEVSLERLEEVAEKVDSIEKDLHKYRGLVGGVLVVVTSVITLLKISWGYIKEHWVP